MSAFRLKGASETLWSAYPESLLDVARVVTELGGAEGVILVLAVLFWVLDREQVILVAAVAVAGVGLVLTLKSLAALPRPVADPATVVEPVLEHGDDEYGFPSGHAFTATTVYGGLLYYFDKYRNPEWLAAVAILVGAISLSRIVLRVHYLGDVLVGFVLGLAFLLGVARLMGDDARIGFGIGIAIGVVAVVVTGETGSVVATEEYALTVLGIAIGGFLAAFHVERLPALESRFEGALLVATGLGYVIVVLVLYSIAVAEPGSYVANALAVLFHVVLIGGVLLVPVPVRRVYELRPDRQVTE